MLQTRNDLPEAAQVPRSAPFVFLFCFGLGEAQERLCPCSGCSPAPAPFIWRPGGEGETG